MANGDDQLPLAALTQALTQMPPAFEGTTGPMPPANVAAATQAMQPGAPQFSGLPPELGGGNAPMPPPDSGPYGGPHADVMAQTTPNFGSVDQQPQPAGPPQRSVDPRTAPIYKAFQALTGIGTGPGQLPSGPLNLNNPPPRPAGSRLDMFEQFIGNFLNSFAAGVSAQGTGPGSFGRGLGAAMQAPYNQQMQQYQAGLQGQQAQADIALKQAEAQRMGQMVDTPYGMMPLQLAQRVWPAGIGAQAKVEAAGIQAGTKRFMNTPYGIFDTKNQQYLGQGPGQKGPPGMAQMTQELIDTKEFGPLAQQLKDQWLPIQRFKDLQAGTQGQQRIANQLMEFRLTDQYRRWKENLDIATKKQIAADNMNKAPAELLKRAGFAQSAIGANDDAAAAMDRMEARGVLGTNLLTNKVENFLFNHGAADPDWDAETRRDMGTLQTAFDLASTSEMVSHTGRTSQQIYNDFRKFNNLGQDWSTLRGSMDEAKRVMQFYVDQARSDSIAKLRGAPPPKNPTNPTNPTKPAQGGPQISFTPIKPG